MPGSLESASQKLNQRLRTLDAAFDRHVIHPSVKMRTDRFALQEGFISALWQSWCMFCREILIGSALGAKDSSGTQIASPYMGRTEAEIAYVARELAYGRPVVIIKVLVGSHLEPTWGDLTKVNKIIVGIASTNQGKLLSAFGVGLAIADLQLCRNANAHLNRSLMANVHATKVRYSSTELKHPSDMMLWVDPATKDFVWKTWVDEMRSISILACL